MEKLIYIFSPIDNSMSRYVKILDNTFKSLKDIIIFIPIFGDKFIKTELLLSKLNETSCTILSLPNALTNLNWNILKNIANSIPENSLILFTKINYTFCVKNIMKKIKEVNFDENYVSFFVLKDLKDKPLRIDSKRFITDISKRLKSLDKNNNPNIGEVLLVSAKNISKLFENENNIQFDLENTSSKNYLNKIKESLSKLMIKQTVLTDEFGLEIEKFTKTTPKPETSSEIFSIENKTTEDSAPINNLNPSELSTLEIDNELHSELTISPTQDDQIAYIDLTETKIPKEVFILENNSEIDTIDCTKE